MPIIVTDAKFLFVAPPEIISDYDGGRLAIMSVIFYQFLLR